MLAWRSLQIWFGDWLNACDVLLCLSGGILFVKGWWRYHQRWALDPQRHQSWRPWCSQVFTTAQPKGTVLKILSSRSPENCSFNPSTRTHTHNGLYSCKRINKYLRTCVHSVSVYVAIFSRFRSMWTFITLTCHSHGRVTISRSPPGSTWFVSAQSGGRRVLFVSFSNIKWSAPTWTPHRSRASNVAWSKKQTHWE